MIQVAPEGAFSAKVRIELRVADQCVPVAQIGADQMIFDVPMAFAKSVGELSLYIDESPFRWRVKLKPGPQPARVVAADFEPLPS
jgi:hypothetical protein